jgi:hypothetical protein
VCIRAAHHNTLNIIKNSPHATMTAMSAKAASSSIVNSIGVINPAGKKQARQDVDQNRYLDACFLVGVHAHLS